MVGDLDVANARPQRGQDIMIVMDSLVRTGRTGVKNEQSTSRRLRLLGSGSSSGCGVPEGGRVLIVTVILHSYLCITDIICARFHDCSSMPDFVEFWFSLRRCKSPEAFNTGYLIRKKAIYSN
ncbi:hypothetical protein F5887DRAFT_650297 [Amanita rubescens]|nr:hypothetical protein F5887DRAFT_650297 [Amanita rubescens]